MKEHEEFKIKIIMEENPNSWSINHTTNTTNTSMHINHPQSFEQAFNNSTTFLSTYVSASPSIALNSYAHDNQLQDLPKSWSQLLLGGLGSDYEDKSCLEHFQIINNKMEHWDDQILNHVKHEDSKLSCDINSLYGYNEDHSEVYATTWPQAMPVSSPRSCVTTLSNIMLEIPHNKVDGLRTQQSTHSSSSERNSTATGGGGVSKKARVQSSSSSQPPLKVRKEKLGDRITAIHQLVSPFGKTDTASVLLETIGYIRFLQGQIEALSFPYLGNASENMMRSQLQHSVSNDVVKDLRSRGLCLVPVSITQQIGRDNGADYWAPAVGGGLF